MYYRIVAANVRKGFRDLSNGNYQSVVGQFAPQLHFSFSGDHALGGECHTVPQVRAWFARLYRLFPGIRFDIDQVTVQGLPWDTIVVTRFRVSATLPDGQPYENEGLQFLRLRWGRIVEDRIFEDTFKLVAALKRISDQGVPEAVAASVATV